MTGPLAGRVLLVTRPHPAGTALAERLRGLGAEALAAPTIVVEAAAPGGSFDQAVREASGGRFDWIVFTSAAGVAAWFERGGGVGQPTGSVAVVGDATAEALRAREVLPSLVPPDFTTEALGRAFPEGRGRVLLARADLATADLEEAIRDKGWDVVRVDAYRVRPVEVLPPAAGAALREGRVDAVTFTSPSTVDGFVRLAEEVRPPAICIGPVTAEAARRAGFEVVAEGRPHTEDGLVEAVVRALRRG